VDPAPRAEPARTARVTLRTVPVTPRAVLLAEHEPEVAELARRYLVRAGLRVTVAARTEEAMAALAAGAAGVAVLDLTMPGLDARRVRRLLAEPPAPALPGLVPPAPAPLAPRPAVYLLGASMRPCDLRVSADHCLRRPFSPRMLVSRVLSAAGRPTAGAPPRAPRPVGHREPHAGPGHPRGQNHRP
jgi:two-component system catabolic regulation response regulator CreB